MDYLPKYSGHEPRLRWEGGHFAGSYCAACGVEFEEGQRVEKCPGKILQHIKTSGETK